MITKEVYKKLRQLILIPIYLYEECIEEGMTEDEAIKETYKRFYE
jgi:glutamate formiminotransferase|tara:strand:- start:2745 stop:2879 length:135 start_codon:yes stop_codon:yes gene_type:complete